MMQAPPHVNLVNGHHHVNEAMANESAGVSSMPLMPPTISSFEKYAENEKHGEKSKHHDASRGDTSYNYSPHTFNDDANEVSSSHDVGERLCEWLVSNGAELHKCQIATYEPEVRGVHAKVPLHAGDRVMFIPLHCLITVEMGKATSIGQKLVDLDVEFAAPKHIFLMLFLLTDMANHPKATSFFQCYYDSLPSTLSNMPIFWSKDELKMLQGSSILTQIEDRKAAIARDYDTICAIEPSFPTICSLDRFKWARMIVCRYVTKIHIKSGSFQDDCQCTMPRQKTFLKLFNLFARMYIVRFEKEKRSYRLDTAGKGWISRVFTIVRMDL
jgi:hypothetical protein